MIELVGDFYRRVSATEAGSLDRGQIYWAPVQYLSNQINCVAVVSSDPRNEQLNRYAILPYNISDPSLFNHSPIHDLNLPSDDELLVNRAKHRPVIVVSQKNDYWQPGGGRLSASGLVCVPMYSFHASDSGEFRDRVRAQEYPWWLYLPGTHGFNEGFARLDRLLVIEQSHLQPMRSALTDDAIWYVSEWIRYYLTGEIDDVLWEYREESLRILRQQEN